MKSELITHSVSVFHSVFRNSGASARASGLSSNSGDPATVDDHRDKVRDDQDADAPGQGDPDVGAHRLAGEQGTDGVDDRGHRLVLGEPPHRPGIEAVGTNAELMKGRKISG